jgi:RHS repeat-associated protein
MEVSTTFWEGTYSVGYVAGRNPDGTTAYFSTLDTQASNSTGPASSTLMFPGTYHFKFQAALNNGVCSTLPQFTDIQTITVYVGDVGDDPNNGQTECNSSVAKPINVTNGNMYLSQTDYHLPGFGSGLEIKRTYNSNLLRDALFGFGWSSILDESIEAYGTTFLRLNWNDGRAIYFSRPTTTGVFTPQPQLGFRGQIVKNGDGTYTLTLKDGGVHQFSSAGKVLSLADANNNQIVFTYNGSGKISAITDQGGRVITPTYAANGRVATLSDSVGTFATYTYDWYWSITSVTYADGSKYNFGYDSQHRLTSITDALANVLESHTYDSQGRALTSEVAGNGTERYTLTYVSATETDVTDALNHVTKYFFDKSKLRNVVTRVEGSCGCGNAQIQTWTYDSQLNVSSKTDALTHTTSYTYDTSGNMLTQTDATGTVTYTYNSLGEVLTRTDQMNGVTTNTYNAQGNLLTTTDALNYTTTFTYDSHGQLLTATDPRNNTTTFIYDTSGNLTRRTDALNNQTNIAYDTRGQVTSVTNALNQTTSYEYDLAGRLKKIIYPDTNFVLFTYDLAGRRTKIKDPRGYETTFAYDAAYRLTSETNADAKVTSYSYDLMSNLTGATDALNRTTNYTYDDFNRLTKIKYPEATTGAGRLEENFTYDSAGNLLQKTDQAGRITSFCYDNANRLTSTTDPALKVTTFEYNARSQQTAVVDAINQRYEFVYDALGRRTQEKKGTATMSFVYDAAGNRSQRTDYNNAVTNYTYDALNRLTTISYPDTTSATYGYDVLSRLTTATNPAGTVTIAYDNRSRVSSVTDVFGQVVTYAYDANSNRTQLNLNAATSATYQYDVINRLTQLTDNASLNTTFSYDAVNRLTSRTLPNGVVTTSQYDGLDRLTRLTHAKTGNTLADFQYQFNTVNNITQMTDGAGVYNYSYDSLDRLTAATHPNQTSESYTYDDVGNRIASHQGSSYTYQTFNRLVTANSNTYAYSANGNLIFKTDASGSWTYTWDFENRLKQASKSGGVIVTYSYDALGRRIQVTSSTGGTMKFVYDGADVIRDLDAGGSTIADYLSGPGIDNKLRQTANGSVSYFAGDHLGATRVLTDASGSLTSILSYDSFGNVMGGSASTRYTYTGREVDSDTGLMFYRARWYDPHQGRFISEDPIGLAGGINVFAYVENKPLRFTDPSGLCYQNPKPCDRSIEAVKEAANGVTNKINGASVGVYNGSPIIKFPDDYPQTIDKLNNAGYYSGIFAFNPFDHAGGYEFRTYGSPGFHFKVVYPNVEETHERGRLGVRISTAPAIATDLHIDCNNPVGAGIGGTLSHVADFIRYHTPSWVPPLIVPLVVHP